MYNLYVHAQKHLASKHALKVHLFFGYTVKIQKRDDPVFKWPFFGHNLCPVFEWSAMF
jgi:hypothetical protein